MVYYHHKDETTFLPKVAAFDMDHTILKPKSGAKFPKDRQDWTYMFADNVVKEAIVKAYEEDGCRIVIFTNQAGIEKKKQNKSDIQGKIEDLERDLGIPITAFCACANDHHRKPTTAMWDLLERTYNGGNNIDRLGSFYCGDAAGRPKGWDGSSAKDFSSSDRCFALNVGVPFLLPEEFFLGQDCSQVPYTLDGVDPQKLLVATGTNKKELPSPSTKQELVLLVGIPASGKSTIYKKCFADAGYVHVNRDLMGTPKKCLQATKAALGEGKSVVVDNTNPSTADRQPYITLARECSKVASIRCLQMETSRQVAEHNNFVRVKETEGSVRRIPAVAYNMYKKKFEEPTVKEGFTSVEMVPFLPTFATKQGEALYLQRVEKL